MKGIFMQRSRFTIEFKQQVIQEVKEVGSASQVVRRHNIKPKMLYRWMDQAEHTDSASKAIMAYTPSTQEFRSLEGENKQLKISWPRRIWGLPFFMIC
jgi:transposase